METLCSGYPEEFTDYMRYCRELTFEQQPDYAYVRGLFTSLYDKCCFEHEYIFDWTIQRFRVETPDGLEIEEEHKQG